MLQKFGAEPKALPREMTREHFFHWLDTEFKMLPDILGKVGDYAASVSVDALLRLLEREGCEHLKRLGSKDFSFPDCASLPSGSGACEPVKKIFL